ncbi:MAG: hypothetical protein B6229_03505 [Spirochaetaceae bacterium 4572_7]|nr:MAG: hypothetical protein B6229_03505 [Spirochaetaceae bacterium 4572_7]
MKRGILLIFLLIAEYSAVVAMDNQFYAAGKKAFSVGLYTIAIDNLNIYLKEDDNSDKDSAIYLLGISNYYLSKYNKSVTYLEGLTSDFPKSQYAKLSSYWIGLNYYYLEEYNKASKWFEESSNINSKYRDISNLFNSLSLLQLGDEDRALDSFEKIINSDTASDSYVVEALYRASTIYLEREEVNKGINLLNRIIFDYPDSKYYSDSINLLGESYYLLKEWENAKRIYLLVLDSKNVDNRVSYRRLASISMVSKDYKETKDYLIKYLDEFPADVHILSLLGEVYQKLNEPLLAIETLEKVNELEGVKEVDKNINNYQLGSLYYKTVNYPMAYTYFKKGGSKESLYFTVISGIESNKNIEAYVKELNHQYYNDKLSLDSTNRYINYLEKGKNKQFLKDFLIYVTNIYPEIIEYSLTLGELLLEEKKFDESLKYLSRGYTKGSEYYGDIAYKIGWIYYNKEEYSRSISFFNSLNDGDKDYIKAIYSKSIAYYKLGQYANGKNGFLKLLDMDSPYVGEVSYYLGMIEKISHNYLKAIEYLKVSQNVKKLALDSKDGLGWSYYHLQDYSSALAIYLELIESDNSTIYLFNAGNCYYYIEDYDNALIQYQTVISRDSDLSSSAYYKVIELLFMLNRDSEGYQWVVKFLNTFPTSDTPGEIIISIGDNKLYEGDIDNAIITYNNIMSIFPNNNKYWEKARYRLAEAYYLKKEFITSINLYLDSIIFSDKFNKDSISHLLSILEERGDPELTTYVIDRLDRDVKEQYRVVPLYIEYIKERISPDTINTDIDSLIAVSKSRAEIDQLIYQKAYNFYVIDNIDEAEVVLEPLLTRPEIEKNSKIDALFLKADILYIQKRFDETIDLYLNIYLNYSDLVEKASYALYKGLVISKEIDNTVLYDKIKNILSSEYSESSWGKRGLKDE